MSLWRTSLIGFFLATTVVGGSYSQQRGSYGNAESADGRKEVVVQQPSREVAALDQIVDPDSYVVGPGDQLTIVFSGKLVNSHSVQVTPEGVLLVPEVGPIHVARMTLSSAKQRILDALESSYTGVETSVFLTRLRLVKVTVSGEVENPGIYVLSSGDRISEAIRSAGGILPGASRRNIGLIRGDQRLRVDLLKYSIAGEKTANPYVSEGDIVVVPQAEKGIGQLGIFGPVRSPGSFEYSPGDRLSDLLMLSYGLTTSADSLSFEIVRFEEDHVSKYKIEVELPSGDEWLDSVGNIELQPDDRVYFRSIPRYHEMARSTILGEVVYPGSYPIIEDSTRILDVIEMAGGLTEDASLPEASMLRYGIESMSEQDIEKQLRLSANELNDIEKEYLKFQSAELFGRVSIDFWKLIVGGDSSLNITLKDNDRIRIPKVSRTVHVIGKVVRPGLVEFSPGKSARYYIDLAGGFGWKANKGKVRIVKATTGAIVKPSGEMSVEVGDAVVVPEKFPRDWWTTVKDIGTFLASIATVYIVVDQALKD